MCGRDSASNMAVDGAANGPNVCAPRFTVPVSSALTEPEGKRYKICFQTRIGRQMSYFGEVAVDTSLPAFAVLREQFGFVPKVFSAQALLPRLIDAEGALLSTILFKDGSLKRSQRECILLAVAATLGNAYCFSLHY